MSADPSFGLVGVETLCAEGVYRVGVIVCEVGGRGRVTGARGLRNMLPGCALISEHEAIREDVRKASFAMRFLSQRIAALYHCLGALSEGRPVVRQAT